MKSIEIVPVYLLVAEGYDDTEILGIFTTAKKAKKYRVSIKDEYPEHDLVIHILVLDVVEGKKV